MRDEASASVENSLERIDRLTERMLRLAEPLRFDLARSSRDLEAVFRLRFQTAVEHGWTSPEQFPSGMEKDGYDDDALQIVALDGDAVVGTTRIVLPGPGRKLPVEEAFSWEAEPSGCVVDVGRACRHSRYDDPYRRVFLGLLAQVWIEMRKRNFTDCCGAVGLKAIRLYERLGLRVIQVALPRLYWGEERWPVLVRPHEADARLNQAVRIGESQRRSE